MNASRLRKFYQWLGLALVTAVAVSLYQLVLTPPSLVSAQSSTVINGAGATFPMFLYQRWFQEYSQVNPNVRVNYQGIGSAAGIRQLISETVDFGASDVGIREEEMEQMNQEVLLIPVTSGSIVIVYNLPNIGDVLKLSREVYSEIYLGKIKRWNDPKITNLNPNLDLPDLPINVIYRSDGSGSTSVLTKHLSTINEEWKETVGSGLNVSWPAGFGVKANAGVSAQIQQGEGAIGYVEYSFAEQLGLSTAALENRAGNYIQPSLETTANGLEEIDFSENLRGFIPDPSGEEAYPLVTYSWIMTYKNYEDPKKAKALKELLLWSLTEGQTYSEELGYVPIPKTVGEKAKMAVEQIKAGS